MAADKKQSVSSVPATVDSTSLSLAERLFARNWSPTEQKTNQWLAETCLKAAKDFQETAANTSGNTDS